MSQRVGVHPRPCPTPLPTPTPLPLPPSPYPPPPIPANKQPPPPTHGFLGGLHGGAAAAVARGLRHHRGDFFWGVGGGLGGGSCAGKGPDVWVDLLLVYWCSLRPSDGEGSCCVVTSSASVWSFLGLNIHSNILGVHGKREPG